MAWPLCAQFRTIDISFEGVGCASCIESLPARMQRIRGVESATATVDGRTGILQLKLAAQNRIRLEQVRDAVEQDGTKVKKATVSVAGTLTFEAGKWLLSPGGSATYEIAAEHPEAGRVEVQGIVADVHAPSPLLIRASRLNKLE